MSGMVPQIVPIQMGTSVHYKESILVKRGEKGVSYPELDRLRCPCGERHLIHLRKKPGSGSGQ